MKRYIWNLLRAADILANTLIGGRVRTISARLGQGQLEGALNWLEQLVHEGLEWGWPGHCLDSYELWKKLTEVDEQRYGPCKVREPSEIYQRRAEDSPTTGGSTVRDTGGSGY